MPGPANLAFGNLSNSFIVQLSVATASVGANTTVERTFTLLGIRLGDVITVNKPTAQAGLGIVNARASAADQIAITFSNNTGGGIVPTTESYLIQVDRPGYDSVAQIPTAIG